MPSSTKSGPKAQQHFFLRIILPTLLSFILFTLAMFTVIIPSFERNMFERKREMIRELTNTAYSVIDEYHALELADSLSRSDAQYQCAEQIRNMRYGEEGKDYFWITDMHPYMVMHPYRPDLEQTDLRQYSDPEGKRLFVVFVDTVKERGEGYVDYMWQWKDDSTRIVPKLSFVRGFEPWGWVIGTGIYVEDVRAEIHNLTTNLVYISIGILIILGILLFVITQQSLVIERKRRSAAEALRESEERYRSLVEASTEGLVLYLADQFVSANNTMLSILGLPRTETNDTVLRNALLGEGQEATSGAEYFRSIIRDSYPRNPVEAELTTSTGALRRVLLTASPITLGEKQGVTIIVRDLGIESESGEREEASVSGFKQFMDKIRVGVFRADISNFDLIELNDTAAEFLGFSKRQDAIGNSLTGLIANANDRAAFIEQLKSHGKTANHIVSIQKLDGGVLMLSISATAISDESGRQLYYDGILEDVTERLKADEDRENLIVELQASLHFLYEPVDFYIKDVVSCPLNWPIQKAAELMSRMKYSSILITSEKGEYIGIVTDRDLRNRVTAAGLNASTPVHQVMTSPIITIRENTLIFDAFIAMHEHGTRHLAVRNEEGLIISQISSEELLQVQRHSASFILKEIKHAKSVDDLAPLQQRQAHIVHALVESGAKSKRITKIISSVTDAVMVRLTELAIEELGPPPVPFVFMALGSQGREEQTLHTDQDNAIVYADAGEAQGKEVAEYFQALAVRVCSGMNESGYHFCPGEAMARNPKWCRDLSAWKDYYRDWIHNANPQDLIDLSIFFDFRHVFGDEAFVNELRQHVFATAEHQAGFFLHLTKNSLLHKPPVDMLGRIQLESKGEHADTFNIKNTLMPLSDFARLYSIRHKISATNTVERYQQLRLKGIIQESTYQELLLAYNTLMQLRLRHQTQQLARNLQPDNAVRLTELTQIEVKTLKSTFTQITSIQKALSYEFTGEAL